VQGRLRDTRDIGACGVAGAPQFSAHRWCSPRRPRWDPPTAAAFCVPATAPHCYHSPPRSCSAPSPTCSAPRSVPQLSGPCRRWYMNKVDVYERWTSIVPLDAVRVAFDGAQAAIERARRQPQRFVILYSAILLPSSRCRQTRRHQRSIHISPTRPAQHPSP